MMRLYTILIALLLTITTINTFANTSIVFASSVPVDREVVRAPRGYVNCHRVPASYRGGVWTNQHKVCEYSRNRGVWVSGHWECLKLRHDSGVCMRWNWAPSHWVGAPVTAYHRPIVRPVSHATYAVAQTQRIAAPVPVHPVVRF